VYTQFSEIHVAERQNRMNLIGRIFYFKKSVGWFFVLKKIESFWHFSVDDVRWPGLSEHCMIFMHFCPHNE
jgi:hypothetical protein